MNLNDFVHLLNRPTAVNDQQVPALERITEEFPFFQSARAVYLKGLYNQDSFKYNQALKLTAAYTTDRSVLFDFITSGNFVGLQQAFLEDKESRINEILVNEAETIITVPKAEPKANTLEQSILSSIKVAVPAEPEIEEVPIAVIPIAAETVAETIEEKLEIGKPLDFSKDEKHSFGEWLQLAAFKPIERSETGNEATAAPEAVTDPEDSNDPEKKKKLAIIDRFIESNPKISPVRDSPPSAVISLSNADDTSYLMTETLAKVYLEQRKYQKAIQAYEILILKYPEKSSLFADRISDIKTLQQNNN